MKTARPPRVIAFSAILRKEDVIKLHERLIEEYGGAQGILYEATIDFAIESSLRHDDFVKEAAMLLKTHCSRTSIY